jgi:hypothetical protein
MFMPHNVFISYSTKDKGIANRICVALEKCGVKCWMAPRDIIPGVSWSTSIISAIEETLIMVLVFSRFADNSEQVKRELTIAVEAKCTIIPFRIDNSTPSKEFKYYLSTSHWLDAFTMPFDQHIGKLVDCVSSFVNDDKKKLSIIDFDIPNHEKNSVKYEGNDFDNDGKIMLSEPNIMDSKNNNYVFFFGRPSSGKSVILASMLYCMNVLMGVTRPRRDVPNSKEAEILLFDFLDQLRKGKFPYRTATNTITRIDISFEPNNKSKKIIPIDLTFLEMSGEFYQKIRNGSAFDKSVEQYLFSDIPISIIMVTDYDNAMDDDLLMYSFLSQLEKNGKSIRRINAILVISKWDKSGTKNNPDADELNYFIKRQMPMMNSHFDTYSLYKTFYTVGRVSLDKNGQEILECLDLCSAKTLTEWLYSSITGIDLNYQGGFWEQIFQYTTVRL